MEDLKTFQTKQRMVPVLVKILKFDDLAIETWQKQDQIKVVFEHWYNEYYELAFPKCGLPMLCFQYYRRYEEFA